MNGVERYQRYIGRKYSFLLVAAGLLVILTSVSVSLGAVDIPFEDVFSTLFLGSEGLYNTIIWNIRLPRVLTAIAAGAALAVAGAVMQCILRNPLASPYTLGLSQAAAFGASIAIVIFGAGTMQSSSTTGVIVNNPYVITVCAFLGALLGTGIIVLLSALTRVSPEAMILAGIAIGSMFGAGITAIQFFADSVQLSSIVFWTFGDLGKTTWMYGAIITMVTIPILLYFIYNRWNYNAIEAGEETAKGLGVNVNRLRMVGMVLSSLLAAVVVSFMGIIGFVGLLGPHIVRRMIGADYRFLIPGSALVGGLILMVSDTVARTLISPLVLPVGVLTAFLGGPLFIYLLIRGYRK
ncbi:MAG: iron ABC transporter permease [Methanomassiliicoccales archaeon]|nr:iron ABC transporter permease [Methanomassiliicoccales archaeon]